MGRILRVLEWPFRVSALGLVRGYQLIVSPHLPAMCRFEPSCSNYALIALREKSFPVALALVVWRLLRCNPLCRGGYDPVPLGRAHAGCAHTQSQKVSDTSLSEER